jgi:hypothetical protein
MMRFYSLGLCLLTGLLAFTCIRDYPATAPYTTPIQTPPAGGLPAQEQPSANKRLYLSNDKVRVAIDLNMGGAINYLSEANSNENMISNPDLGRQLQTSIYSGPIPYSINGKQPVDKWWALGWNPVQAGDYYLHPAQIVSYQQTQNQLYVKSVPKIWPLFDQPADCVFEHWLDLKDNTVHVHVKVTVNRADTTQYDARTQEIPCVYLTGPYYHKITYSGAKPFTNDATTEYTAQDMISRYGTENWAALLNDKGRGVGLYTANQFSFQTAGFGIPNVGGEFDQSSGYINSSPWLVIDYNGQYEFDYTIIVGSLADIRQFAYSQPRPITRPNFNFVNDRQGWSYYNANDTGWPIKNELNIRWQRRELAKGPLRIASPVVFWQAADLPKVYLQAAFTTKGNTARLVWRKPDELNFYDIPSRYVEFPIIGDGQYRTYEINLQGANGWDGVICQVSLTSPDSQNEFEKGANLRIKSLTASRP